MIENIKRFVDEHRTLIAVIIVALVICFLYWLLFSKCGSTGKKVKGGSARKKVCYLGDRRVPFEVLGMPIDGDFFVLNEDGRREVENTSALFKTYVRYVHYYTHCNFEGDYLSLPNLVKNPYHFFNLNTKSGSAVINLIPNERKSKKKPEPLRRCDHIEKCERFSFEKSLDIAIEGKGVKKDIMRSFDNLRKFVHDNFHVYFDRVNYIGQPAVCKAEVVGCSAEAASVPALVISKNDKGNVGGELSFSIKDFLRSWYPPKGKDAREMFRTHAWIGKNEVVESGEEEGEEAEAEASDVDEDSENFGIGIRTKIDVGEDEKFVEPFVIQNDLCGLGDVGVQSGNIEGVSNGKRAEKKWEIADIFPAHKLLEMIYFLFGLMEYYVGIRKGENGDDGENEYVREYFKMLASYIIFVNLFNGYCGIQMESRWNEKVGNLYVYNFAGQWTGIKTGAVMQPFAVKLVEESILGTMGKELSEMKLDDEKSMMKFLEALTPEAKKSLFEADKSLLMARLREKEKVVAGFEETEWDAKIEGVRSELVDIIGGLISEKSNFPVYLLELKEKENETPGQVGVRYKKFRAYCKNIWNELARGLILPDSAPESQGTDPSWFGGIDLVKADQDWEKERAESVERLRANKSPLDRCWVVDPRKKKKKLKGKKWDDEKRRLIAEQKICTLMIYSGIEGGDDRYVKTCEDLWDKYLVDPEVRRIIDEFKAAGTAEEIEERRKLVEYLLGKI